MEVVLRFLEENELWVYILAGLAALMTLRWLLKAWRDWRNSVFGLERDIVQRTLAARGTVLALLALLVVFEFVLVSFIIPANPRMFQPATPTLNILATPSATLAATAVLGLTPTASGVTTPETLVSEGCTPGQIEWSVPQRGDILSGTVELTGSVNVPNLGFYKYEYGQPGSDEWVTIAAGNRPLVNGTIGYWNTAQLPAGDYLLRLVVVDNQNQFFPACLVSIQITPP
jgi:hypothetical protein